MCDSQEIIIVGMLDMKYEKTARVYYGGGIAPTVSARDYKDAIKIIEVKNPECVTVRN